MIIRNLKFCVLFLVFTSLFSCTSDQHKVTENAQTENTEQKIGENTEQNTETEVEKEAKQEENELIIYQKSFLGLSPDTKITDFGGTLEKGFLKTGEGDFDIFNLKDENGNTVAYFVPFGKNQDEVGAITVTSTLAKTEDGIKIGDTFGSLLEKYPNLKVYGSEIEGYTQALVGNLGYRLDEPHYVYELKIIEIKKETKIIEIIVK